MERDDGWPATDDPGFYCHGQKCLDGGCNPLFCEESRDAIAESGSPGSTPGGMGAVVRETGADLPPGAHLRDCPWPRQEGRDQGHPKEIRE